MENPSYHCSTNPCRSPEGWPRRTCIGVVKRQEAYGPPRLSPGSRYVVEANLRPRRPRPLRDALVLPPPSPSHSETSRRQIKAKLKSGPSHVFSERAGYYLIAHPLSEE
jgi:hypothetical protein